MNHDVLPTSEKHEVKIETAIFDNGREFCGRPGQYSYEFFVHLEVSSIFDPREAAAIQRHPWKLPSYVAR